jgi:hypothetical protein
MGKVVADITMTLDGFIAGPHASLEHPLGEGGERIHEWMYGLASFRKQHGEEGGEANADSDVLEEAFTATGATIMGRKMFSGGSALGRKTPTPRVGGETIHPSKARSSCSRTTRARRCRSRAAPRSPS